MHVRAHVGGCVNFRRRGRDRDKKKLGLRLELGLGKMRRGTCAEIRAE
jgi:hypothetical protein